MRKFTSHKTDVNVHKEDTNKSFLLHLHIQHSLPVEKDV